MKLRLAQAREPMREMKRPKPGTPAATRAINSTRAIRTATKTALCVLELYLSLKDACSQSQCQKQACIVWAVWYITRLLVELTPKGVVFSVLFSCQACVVRALFSRDACLQCQYICLSRYVSTVHLTLQARDDGHTAEPSSMQPAQLKPC